MAFWRGQKTRQADTNSKVVSPSAAAEPARDTAPASLKPEELRRTVDPKTLGFTTTAELDPITGLIGQERALAAIEFGVSMRAFDYNIFVLGPPASGKRTALKAQLEPKAASHTKPDDWVYVYNFSDPTRPRALRLPPGRAPRFAKAMIGAIDELRGVVPALFEGDDYRTRRRTIDGEFQATQEHALEELNRRAADNNLAILRTPNGFAIAPTHEGKVVKPETFNALPESMRTEKQAQIAALEAELSSLLERMPKSEKDRRARISALNEEIARIAVAGAIDDVTAEFSDVPQVLAHLETAAADLVRNIAIFLPDSDSEHETVREPADTARDVRFRRYMVNVMVSHGASTEPQRSDPTSGAPLVDEINPVYGNLVGRIEHVAQMGTIVTDFLLIKPGALHRANGGYLLLDARKLLLSPFAYEALKRALRAREIRIEQPAEAAGILAPQSLDPEPIPLDVKVFLIGERDIYYLLAQNDPDFSGLFKVQADFDDTIERNGANNLAYARIVASIVREHSLLPLDASAVARIIEHGARLADDREKLSIEIGYISDLVREADYWARKSGHKTTTAADVDAAIDAQIQRADRVRDRSQETVDRGIVLVDTTGAKVGQINGLAVLQIGDFSFGRPNRITARVRMGSGRITDIEREAKLGGALHTKGMMILNGFIAGRYAQDFPLALAATLTFEQSYGGVDGDSASSTEIYALLSALAEVPIRQGLAVTGSVNQWGEVQAIGGVNEKIEGFFDTCAKRGLTGDQGVLIPASNVQHLMLRQDVVDAVRDGRFSIYAVRTIDQGIELLTGLPAGERDASGTYPPGTINARVEDRLRRFAENAKKFGGRFGDDKNSTPSS
ncbi:MAG TPA: ATP-binding protein [Hyphomicrobiaceae bacterium]|nr:ATP-binding protein [Hyphomicrobiaceae bacterium]